MRGGSDDARWRFAHCAHRAFARLHSARCLTIRLIHSFSKTLGLAPASFCVKMRAMNAHAVPALTGPQSAMGWDHPGSYQLAARTSTREVEAGGNVVIDVFVVGYGLIEGCKVTFYPPLYFIDKNQSYCYHSMKDNQEPGGMEFGAVKSPLADDRGSTVVLSSGGLRAPGWTYPSLFFDTHPQVVHRRTDSIATELLSSSAPIRYDLRVQENIRAGTYTLPLFLTYNDGYTWNSKTTSVDIIVPNWFQRHQLLVWILGTVIATILGLAQIASAVYPIVSAQDGLPPATSQPSSVPTVESPSPSLSPTGLSSGTATPSPSRTAATR